MPADRLPGQCPQRGRCGDTFRIAGLGLLMHALMDAAFIQRQNQASR